MGKTSLWKRFSAFIVDLILIVILSLVLSFAVSEFTVYDRVTAQIETLLDDYGSRYGVVFDITESGYQALGEAERAAYTQTWEELETDGRFVALYNTSIRLSILITLISVILAVVILEFSVPLLFKKLFNESPSNGQTVGKRLFRLQLECRNGTSLTVGGLLLRSVVGKGIVEISVPLAVFLLVYYGIIAGGVGLAVIMALAVAQILCFAFTQDRCLVHDVLARTHVVPCADNQ